MFNPGLDIVAHLNLAEPRDFLLQVEDELDAYVATGAGQEAVGRGLRFPPLARPFESLLQTTACRYGLKTSAEEDRRHRSYILVTRPPKTSENHGLPLFSYADFLRVQRPPGPPQMQTGSKPEKTLEDSSAAATSISAHLVHRMRLRLWALRATTDPGDDATQCPAGEELCASALQQSLDSAIAARAGGRHGGCSSDESESRRPTMTKKRGRGFETSGDGTPPLRTRHCYSRFGPKAARRLYLRDDFVRAPWPTAKLRRVAEPGVTWRPEWRAGPMADESNCSQALGGVLSWAVQSKDFAFGEGFEVNLRSGPGPESVGDESNPERCNDDFLLTFRRGTGAWHFTAGSRARLAAPPALRTKAVPDSSDRSGIRRMFWVACVESRSDGKHYVVVGTVPGILTEHFFVAKVGRAEPLSHAGFSYLPEPGRVAFGCREDHEPPPVVLESISVYPHGLAGELPFVSLRFVEEHCSISASLAIKSEAAEAADGAAAVKAEAEQPEPVLARALLNTSGDRELRILRRPIPLDAAGGAAGSADGGSALGPHGSSWSLEAKRESGLLSAKDAVTSEERLERRARRRVEVPVIASNFVDAPSSWEPRTVDEPEYGPFDDTLRHDPLRWDPYLQLDV